MQKNGGAWQSTPASVVNGDTLTVRHVSAAANLASVSTTLTIGTVSENFISRTEAAPVAGPTLILAILAGQSNMVGNTGADRTVDVDVPNVFQFVCYAGSPSYQTWQSDITPLMSYDGWVGYTPPPDRLGPGEYIARQLLADNPGSTIGLIPVGKGATDLIGGTTHPAAWQSSPTPGSGGFLFENMINQVNLAYTKAQAQWPGLTIVPRVFWVQGENDAGHGVTRAAYYDAFASWVSDLRSRLSWVASAPIVVGSMIPYLWDKASTGYNPAYAGINAAHVDASLNLPGVYYSRGNDAWDVSRLPTGGIEGLHYSPAVNVRTQGLRMAATLTDVTGPTITGVTGFASQSGQALVFALTCNDSHATYHLNGGADAALFEISDPYLTPTLRWVGNGGGPGVGSYSVGVRARDGRGNYGPTQTITISVSAEVSPVTAFTSGQKGFVIDLTDTSVGNLAQNIDGTGAVSDGSFLGFVRDLSPNANHWTAAANNTTRPKYRIDSDGSPYIDWTGTQALYQASPFAAPTNGRWTSSIGIFGAAPTVAKGLLVANSATGGAAQLQPYQLAATGGSITTFMRNDNSNGGSPNPLLTGILGRCHQARRHQYL
jgi:hypothetical protein